MKKQLTLNLKSAIGAAFFLGLSTLAFAEASGPPNIVMIAIDDMNDWTGFLGGHPQAITPNMDSLSKKGVNFPNAQCPAPGCSPSRNAILYGVEPFNSGLYAFYGHSIHDELIEKYTSLPEFLMENGYETFGAGKIHHGSREFPQEWSDYHKPTRHKLKMDMEQLYQVGGDFKTSFGPTLNPYEEHPDHKVATYGVEVLSKKHEKPFFLAVGLVKPHLPFLAPQDFFDLYPDPVDPPRILEDDIDDIPWVGKSFIKRRDNNQFNQDNAWDRVRRAYLACISWVDYNVGRVLEALEESEYADNTIVVLWSDHGYALGEKGHFRKFALWEDTTHVPFIIWDTREHCADEGRTVKDGVSLINIYRTLAELIGNKTPEYVDGYSLVPQLKDPSAPVAGPSICTWGRGNYTIRDTDFRYIRYFDGSEELYAHLDDPDEWTNLADNPDFASVKERMSAFLPKEEAPLWTDEIQEWSIVSSADRPQRK
ncbi:sulfatase [Puniceicoccales bacterium CK1056]|uniref:Sulfatase n=1 Tax=Oceanipulchritudo coccoides TaxID=2706888 RepID=A0A6B2M0E5_9BACT|nr:sulfatase [Oceanipulchritudo coccoides]NDV61497.1 sulfatase [Oceanipulchritudo coccoides]